jgi:hypothetical protein
MAEQTHKRISVTLSSGAERQWQRILVFYTKRNQSSQYSEKLNAGLIKLLETLADEHFEPGEQTSRKNIRRISFEKFAVFFRITKDYLEVTSIVDARRNVPLN